MSQIVVLAAIGTVAYMGYRYLKRLGTGFAMPETPVRVKSVYLERGPDGIFRPTDRVSTERI